MEDACGNLQIIWLGCEESKLDCLFVLSGPQETKKVCVSNHQGMINWNALVDFFRSTILFDAESRKNIAKQYTGEHTWGSNLGIVIHMI